MFLRLARCYRPRASLLLLLLTVVVVTADGASLFGGVPLPPQLDSFAALGAALAPLSAVKGKVSISNITFTCGGRHRILFGCSHKKPQLPGRRRVLERAVNNEHNASHGLHQRDGPAGEVR